ncbi:hypothetical protein BO82DRAFT_372920 [Aspergillus uvarum CBS 121591]|uniref:Uncharacterized protein n=1 Tax=Aspergillus uvarum CBS 121591 TaxID=1448315 RepID=A0A319CY48_9EURO|nr:hypothetical protein BO82DRAFT_372920 [Aspergillus uvarum CBS 121591]PYH83783.1 hypothetical protein BO82DRAFT_372920 [Aspergillus uvarum CBS 121591]
MKSLLPQNLSLCTADFVLSFVTELTQQELLISEDLMADDRVSGHNNAVYNAMELVLLPNKGLINTTLKISSSAVYLDRLLKTTTFNNYTHLIICNTSGVWVNYMASSSRSDLLLDFQIPTIFLKTGMWTFKVDARAGDEDNMCLFAVKMTQWLKGGLH